MSFPRNCRTLKALHREFSKTALPRQSVLIPPQHPRQGRNENKSNFLFSGREKTSVCTSLGGSMTVEAAIVLPLSLMVIWVFWLFFSALALHVRIQFAMDEVTGMMAQQSFLLNAAQDRFQLDDGEVSFPKAIGSAAWKSAARQWVVYKVGRDAFRAGHVSGGSGGIFVSGTWDKTRDICLTLHYRLEFPGVPGRIFTLPVSQTSRRRCWTGMQCVDNDEKEGSGTADPVVFITESGTVYHRDIGCYHLDLTVREISSSSLAGARSRDGSKYYPCEYCAQVSHVPGILYITPEGNRYHITRDCSGLKRRIRSVPLSETGGRRPCSHCGN